MDILVIGSKALAFRLPHKGIRKGKDLDIVGTYDDVQKYIKKFDSVTTSYPLSSKKWFASTMSGIIIEATIAWDGSNDAELLELVKKDPDTYNGGGTCYPSLDVLYALKMSHRYLRNSPHFTKTHDDIMLLRSVGAKISDRYMPWFLEREKLTYDYSHPKLNVTKKNFFKDDGIGYVYDHDDIHEAVKNLDEPAYTYFKPEGKEVWCSKEMFFSVPEETRLFAVLEESIVLSIERSQVPFGHIGITPRDSFEIALRKVCTSITSGFFREYAWENYRKVQSMYSDVYVEKFWEAVADDRVKKHT